MAARRVRRRHAPAGGAVEEDRTLVRTWAVRGTLHLLPPRDLGVGPPDGRSVTFLAPRVWIGNREVVEPSTAVQDVLRAFLDAYGPPDLDEMQRWSALDQPVLRAAVRELGNELDVEGTAAG